MQIYDIGCTLGGDSLFACYIPGPLIEPEKLCKMSYQGTGQGVLEVIFCIMLDIIMTTVTMILQNAIFIANSFRMNSLNAYGKTTLECRSMELTFELCPTLSLQLFFKIPFT